MRSNIKEQRDYKDKFNRGVSAADTLFKFMPLKYVIPTISRRRLRFDLVRTWEDVYENYFFKQSFMLNNIPVNVDEVVGRMYGQSWSYNEDTDAMWRIYSGYNIHDPLNIDRCAIRLKVNAERLFDVVYTDDLSMADTFIGRVDYRPQDEIEDRMNTLAQNPTHVAHHLNDIAIDFLLLKREAFSHEDEARILITRSTIDNPPLPFLLFDIDPNTLFEEYCIDPRVSASAESKIREELIDAGADPAKITKSPLYTVRRTFTINI